MADVHVLVVFYSRYGKSEELALAAGVGAIQAKGDIRLRRLGDSADQAAIDEDAAWKSALERMRRDYVEPRPADFTWADVVILAVPSDAPGEMLEYLDRLRGDSSAPHKLAAPIVGGVDVDARLLDRLRSACQAASMTVCATLDGLLDAGSAREVGHRAVAAARDRERPAH